MHCMGMQTKNWTQGGHPLVHSPQVLMATNRPDPLDPALPPPGRPDPKVQFGLPDLESRTQVGGWKETRKHVQLRCSCVHLPNQVGSGAVRLMSMGGGGGRA